MKVIIIDDEPLARSIVAEYLQSHSDIQIVAECNNGFEGIKAIQQHQPNLIFLDIQMPKLNGFEMLELIDFQPKIIFTTAFDEYALRAFETNAADYLLKPFSQERFDKALLKVHQQATEISAKISETIAKQPDESKRIVVKVNGDIKILPTEEVMYIEAYDDYVKIYTPQQCLVKKKTMVYYEKTLDNQQFVRIHRSYILNIKFIDSIVYDNNGNAFATLRNTQKIAISKNGLNALKNLLG